jgi:hypothetical protein
VTFKKFKQKRSASEKGDGNSHVFADSGWEMVFKAIEEPLGNAKKVWERRWEIPKGYWIA